MRMYTQKLKECDHAFKSECVDLSKKGNYLILPSKFLTYTQQIKTRNNQVRVKIIYTIEKRFLNNPLVRLKQKNKPVDYFCIVYPSGRVEQWDISKAIYDLRFNFKLKENENRLCIYLASSKRVTVELMESSISEESNHFQKNYSLCRLTNRNLQLKERSKTIEKSSNRMFSNTIILNNAFANG